MFVQCPHLWKTILLHADEVGPYSCSLPPRLSAVGVEGVGGGGWLCDPGWANLTTSSSQI